MSSTSSQATCRCQHLTSFALLVEPATYATPDPDFYKLRSIYYIGLIISIALMVYLLLVLIFRRFVLND